MERLITFDGTGPSLSGASVEAEHQFNEWLADDTVGAITILWMDTQSASYPTQGTPAARTPPSPPPGQQPGHPPGQQPGRPPSPPPGHEEGHGKPLLFEVVLFVRYTETAPA